LQVFCQEFCIKVHWRNLSITISLLIVSLSNFGYQCNRGLHRMYVVEFLHFNNME
jgi:hypothetical protein